MSYPNRWNPKGLREHLCQQQTFAPDDRTRKYMSEMIALLDIHRPIGPDGKHGNRHTPTCGCELDDDRPHSRACGIFCRGHGPECSSDCPTCGGR